LTQDDPYTTSIDVLGFQQVRSEALKAHATQVDPNSPFWFGLPAEVLEEIHPVELFLLAESRVGDVEAGTTEDDLFAGVR
jgi:mycothiol S-conjugate amidase